MDKDKLLASLNLYRRLPASRLRQNVSALANLRPELQDEILRRVEQPLEVLTDEKNGLPYIKSEYNRDGDSYRSPHSNEYYPPIDKPLLPSPALREMEQKAMPLFREYVYLYYESALHSTYFWDKEDGGFACAILIKKEVDQSKGVKRGTWDSINVVDVTIDKSKQRVNYRITTTAMLSFVIENETAGEVTLAGTYTKQREDSDQYKELNDEFHLANIGKLLEETETQVRNYLEVVYFGKTKGIVFNTRFEDESAKKQKEVGTLLPGMKNAMANSKQA
mmetsp:Transcript_74856/g.86900  ORF Transcript_74856/g.86900 Transcript_74856/m.86900 type:complete len:278 (+) Transcript_74856:18-851(+)|eukprot:CAMPEP_0176432710 /NCGR_PEP_ID=MMETSP0127-20121128/15549_1 /TAXON_ID=938130 /ORGANISM="Platyophrya macrostoma, Strain WH" /LENGTH=277 /DNA_ID=CAMNT_0017814919 /DNA_START=18 /DNA_END=851 /DNA_ORIENTATION=-